MVENMERKLHSPKLKELYKLYRLVLQMLMKLLYCIQEV
jgi:hypothetical protein